MTRTRAGELVMAGGAGLFGLLREHGQPRNAS
jgi:hypothetical protein